MKKIIKSFQLWVSYWKIFTLFCLQINILFMIIMILCRCVWQFIIKKSIKFSMSLSNCLFYSSITQIISLNPLLSIRYTISQKLRSFINWPNFCLYFMHGIFLYPLFSSSSSFDIWKVEWLRMNGAMRKAI